MTEVTQSQGKSETSLSVLHYSADVPYTNIHHLQESWCHWISFTRQTTCCYDWSYIEKHPQRLPPSGTLKPMTYGRCLLCKHPSIVSFPCPDFLLTCFYPPVALQLITLISYSHVPRKSVFLALILFDSSYSNCILRACWLFLSTLVAMRISLVMFCWPEAQ